MRGKTLAVMSCVVTFVVIVSAPPPFFPTEKVIAGQMVATHPTPDPANSYAEWRNPTGPSKPMVCPNGDGNHIFASIRDRNNNPIPNLTVTTQFYTSCDMCICQPTWGVTDANGQAIIPIHAGLDASPSTACCGIVSQVLCASVAIPWGLGGSVYDSRDWTSPDLNGDCIVDAADSTIFMSDYMTSACRSDFDDNGVVDLVDYGTFVLHYRHTCDPTPRVDPAKSTLQWRNLPCDSTVMVCPEGDGSWLYIRVADQYWRFIPDAIVTPSFNASCNMCLCPDVTAVTDAGGEAEILLHAGLDVQATTACCIVVTAIQCQGTTLFWNGTTDLGDTSEWISPDYTADCKVDLADQAIFASDYLTTACRSDFDCDGDVDLVDNQEFIDHFGHICDPSPFPDPGYSRLEWHNLICGNTKAFVCPAGDGSWLRVFVRDQYNQGMSGALVTLNPRSGCPMCLCDPISGTTDASGQVDLDIYGGVDASASSVCCTVTTQVHCLGRLLPWVGDSREWLSPDLNGDANVNAVDDSIFVSDYLTTACRTDYDCSGSVDLLDYGEFTLHYAHSCDPSGVPSGSEVAGLAELDQNYPNPFTPSTQIRYFVAGLGRVRLRVYDVTGRHVRTLVDGIQEAGWHESTWDGCDDSGDAVSPGVYFCRYETLGHTEMKRMVLLK